MSKKLLVIKNLKVIYKTGESIVEAINDVNMEIYKGETVGFVGETGAGKTTTALSIMNLLPERTGKIVRGEIYFKGKNLLALPYKEIRRIRGNEISMIFQDPMTSLNPVFTIDKQVGEVLRMHTDLNDKEVNEEVSRVLELVGIQEQRRYDYPHQFSGGMKQRVVIAMALISNPELLIADEPTTALDVTLQAQVLDLMKKLKNQFDTAMLMITHDLGVVAETCDRVAIIYAGEIVETGTLEDIFNGSRHHPYTEGLFGSIPDLNKRTERLNPIPGLMPDPTSLPEGCFFYPRCKKRLEKCRNLHPKYATCNTHQILCHLF